MWAAGATLTCGATVGRRRPTEAAEIVQTVLLIVGYKTGRFFNGSVIVQDGGVQVK